MVKSYFISLQCFGQCNPSSRWADTFTASIQYCHKQAVRHVCTSARITGLTQRAILAKQYQQDCQVSRTASTANMGPFQGEGKMEQRQNRAGEDGPMGREPRVEPGSGH